MSCRSSLVFFEGGFTTSSRLPPPPTALRLANWIFSFKPSSWNTGKGGAEPSKSGKSMESIGKYDGKLKENIQYTGGCKSCRISACWSVGFQSSNAYTWANSQSVLRSFSGPGEVGDLAGDLAGDRGQPSWTRKKDLRRKSDFLCETHIFFCGNDSK